MLDMDLVERVLVDDFDSIEGIYDIQYDPARGKTHFHLAIKDGLCGTKDHDVVIGMNEDATISGLINFVDETLYKVAVRYLRSSIRDILTVEQSEEIDRLLEEAADLTGSDDFDFSLNGDE